MRSTTAHIAVISPFCTVTKKKIETSFDAGYASRHSHRMILFKMSSVSVNPVLCFLYRRRLSETAKQEVVRAYQVPSKRSSNRHVAYCGADKPHNDNRLEFLELFEMGDEVDSDGRANSSD